MSIYFFGDMHNREDSDKLQWSSDNEEYVKFFEIFPFKSGDTAVFTGDINQKAKHSGAVNNTIIRIFDTVIKKDVEVIIVTGNHDLSKYSGNNLHTLKFMKLHISEKIEIYNSKNGKLLLIPHIIDGNISEDYQITEDVDYVVGHHFQRDNNLFDSPYVDERNFKFKFKYFFTGNNHKFEKLSENRYCLGSFKANSSGEGSYNFSYIRIDGSLTVHPIPQDNFYRFREINYQDYKEHPTHEKDQLVVNVLCKKSERFLIDKTIRTTFKNVYKINYSLLEDDSYEYRKLKEISDESLIINFLKEKERPKKVTELFRTYLNRMQK